MEQCEENSQENDDVIIEKEISKLIGILLICKLNKIDRENIFNFFLGYGLCELFVLFGLTSC